MNGTPENAQICLDRAITVLFEIANAVSHTRNLTELYRVIHGALATILPAENFFIAYYDESKETLWFPYFKDAFDPPLNAAPVADFPFIHRVIQSRSPGIFSAQDDPGGPWGPAPGWALL